MLGREGLGLQTGNGGSRRGGLAGERTARPQHTNVTWMLTRSEGGLAIIDPQADFLQGLNGTAWWGWGGSDPTTREVR